MKNILKITYVNNDTNDIYEDETIETNLKSLSELYHDLRHTEKGRITKMYQDDKDKVTRQVGYIVTRKITDIDEDYTFSQSLWIELLEPVKVMREVTEYKNVGI